MKNKTYYNGIVRDSNNGLKAIINNKIFNI